jgi:uncharacterized protein
MRRVLSIDGGGIKGAFPASFLATIEQQVGQSVTNYFDLIVGTSTGGIIALGLGLGLTASSILSFYEQEGPKIFARAPFLSAVRQLFMGKYNRAPLKQALETVFGEHKLGDSKKRLVIPSFNLENGEVYNWKTAHHPKLEHDYTASMVDVALATAAAPTYFPAHRSGGGVPLIDGGVWANNPIAVAVVEAIGILNWPPDDLRVLSLGCTTTPFGGGMARFRSLGRGYWMWKLVDLFTNAQCESAIGMAQHLVKTRDCVKRISPKIGKFIQLDDIGEIPSLVGLGHSECRKELPALRDIFFREPLAEPFEPFHNVRG